LLDFDTNKLDLILRIGKLELSDQPPSFLVFLSYYFNNIAN